MAATVHKSRKKAKKRSLKASPKKRSLRRRRGSDLTPLTVLSARVPAELVADLEQVAERRNEPKTALVRFALEDFLEEPKNRRRR